MVQHGNTIGIVSVCILLYETLIDTVEVILSESHNLLLENLWVLLMDMFWHTQLKAFIKQLPFEHLTIFSSVYIIKPMLMYGECNTVAKGLLASMTQKQKSLPRFTMESFEWTQKFAKYGLRLAKADWAIWNPGHKVEKCLFNSRARARAPSL